MWILPSWLKYPYGRSRAWNFRGKGSFQNSLWLWLQQSFYSRPTKLLMETRTCSHLQKWKRGVAGTIDLQRDRVLVALVIMIKFFNINHSFDCRYIGVARTFLVSGLLVYIFGIWLLWRGKEVGYFWCLASRTIRYGCCWLVDCSHVQQSHLRLQTRQNSEVHDIVDIELLESGYLCFNGC